MKKNRFPYIILVALGLAFLLQACNKSVNPSDTKIQFTTTSTSVKIPVMLRTSEYDSVIDFKYKINMDSFVKMINSGFDTGSIRSVKFTGCRLELDSNNTVDNFSNFNTCSIGLTTGTVPNLIKIASATDIPDTPAYFLNIPKTYDWDLKDYMRSDSLCYRIFGNVRRTSTKALGFKAVFTYDMQLSN
jgi:hypothetical protein